MDIFPVEPSTGDCRLNPDQGASVLGGKDIWADMYPKHGSMQLEKLPLGTDSVIWTRGDSISRPEANVPKKKLKVFTNPKRVSS